MTITLKRWSVLLFLVSLCVTVQAQEKPQKVKIASGGHIVHFLPLDLAVALGYFNDEGLEPKITYLKGGTATAQALLSGQVDFSTNSIDHAFKAAVQGKDDLRMVVLLNQTPGMVLAVDSKYKDSVQTIADLKGMRLGVTSIGSATHMVLAFLLSKNGVDPSEVNVVKAGSSTFPPALKNGNIDGGIALEPFASIMVEQGSAFVLQRLITMEDSKQAFDGPYNQAGILTRQDVIENNKALVEKVVFALVRALQFIQEHSPEEIAYVLPTEVTGVEKANYIKTLDLLGEFYSPTGKINPTGVVNVLHSMRASGVLSSNREIMPEEFYNNSFVLRARTSSPNPIRKGNSENSTSNSSSWMLMLILTFLAFLVALVSLVYSIFKYKQLQEQMRYVEFIETLDDFAEKVAGQAKNVKRYFKLALPLPVLYAVQAAEFTKEEYEQSWWWQVFSGKLIENLKYASSKLHDNESIYFELIYLCDSQLRQRVRDLLGDDTKVQDYVDIVDEFIEKIRAIDREKIKVDSSIRVFDLPFWTLVVDHHLLRSRSAVVCFTDPTEVSRKKGAGWTPHEIANELTGIAVNKEHAVRFFNRSFEDIKERLYFYELIQEIKNELSTEHVGIDMTFIHKWEAKLDEKKEWYPHEVLVRSK